MHLTALAGSFMWTHSVWSCAGIDKDGNRWVPYASLQQKKGGGKTGKKKK